MIMGGSMMVHWRVMGGSLEFYLSFIGHSWGVHWRFMGGLWEAP